MTRDGLSALSWDLIRAFIALERHGSYEIAAEMEGIDDSTLRRRIRQLEQHFGRALFVRNESGWKAASDLHALIAAGQRMDEAARSFCHGQAATGVVRISVMDVFAERFAPVFATLGERYPGLRLSITTEAHFVDLEHEQVDVAVRLARPERNHSALSTCRLGEVAVGAYASRAYLARARQAGSSEHPLLAMNLGFFHQDHEFIYAQLDWARFGIRGRVRLHSDSFALLARLCALGEGVALLPKVVAAEHPQLAPCAPAAAAAATVATELWLISRAALQADWQRDLAALLSAELARWPP